MPTNLRRDNWTDLEFDTVQQLAYSIEEFEKVLQFIFHGKGTPEGVITAPVGCLYLRSDGGAGTTLYIKESGIGNAGWIAK